MQLLSGLQPGSPNDKGQFPKKSFNHLIQQRIEKLQNMQKSLSQRAPAGTIPSTGGDEA
jgi:hypothetical protein